MTDQLARLVLIAGFIAVMPIGVYYRLRARTDEKLDRREEGWFILLTLRPLAIACMLGQIAFLINPAWMEWSSVPLPGWLRWSGVVLGVATAGLFIWTFHSLGRNLTDTVVTRREATLVTRGPYRIVRHPFYVAFFAAVTANALVTANWYLAVTGLTAFATIVLRTSTEEAKLLERFGRDYREYMQRTGRFFPRIVHR